MRQPETMQAELDRVQAAYRAWVALLPALEADIERWQQGAALIKQLAGFYDNGAYAEMVEAQRSGAPLREHTEGEYGVLSEDAVWNALGDFHSLALRRLRQAVDAIDRQPEYAD